MKTRLLGNSDLAITSIGFGSWAVGGGGWKFAWGPQDDDESIAAIHRALDLGINWIDTAAVYGLGHSEQIVARALRGRSQKPYVFTKCERVWGPQGEIRGSLKAESIRAECEASLRRLEVDVIDLYQIHWPQPSADIEEGWSSLVALQREGKIRHIGVSNFGVSQMKRAQAIAPITSLQPPYSAVRREVEAEILPYCQENGIGVIVYSPMQAGLLSGAMTEERVAAFAQDDWRRGSADFAEPRLSRALALAALMGEIGKRHGVSAAVVAVAWTLRQAAVTGAIVGARRPAQVDGFIDAAEFRLGADEIARIDLFNATMS